MIRVMVGEDNYLAREGICRVLEAEGDIKIVAACGDLATLRDAVGQQQPDVVLADIQMPPTKTDEGIRFAAELRTTHPGVGVVILSQYAEPLYAIELLEGGSNRRAYLLKERVQHRREVSRAVREVAQGRSVIDSRIVDLLATAKQQRQRARFDELTAPEQEIPRWSRRAGATRGSPSSSDHHAGSGAPRPLDLLQARSRRFGELQPAGQSSAAVSRRPGRLTHRFHRHACPLVRASASGNS